MPDRAIYEEWMKDDSSLLAYVEREIVAALDSTLHGYYLAKKSSPSRNGLFVEKHYNSFVIYPRDQPYADGFQRNCEERSPWPEGLFFILDVARPYSNLVFIHSNHNRGPKDMITQTATTISLKALSWFLADGAPGFTEMFGKQSLALTIRKLVETKPPNVVSLT